VNFQYFFDKITSPENPPLMSGEVGLREEPLSKWHRCVKGWFEDFLIDPHVTPVQNRTGEPYEGQTLGQEDVR
jgi:hypothetical protein